MTTATREGWLHEVTTELRPIIKQRTGLVVPKQILLSCGFPSRRAGSGRIGECHPSQPGTPVFVSPLVHNPLDVAQVLIHELIHAALPAKTGHRAPFSKAARKLDLGGKPTATVRTPALDSWLAPILKAVGKYPHLKIDLSGRKVQSTRLLKLTCDNCSYIIRTTAKWLEQGSPSCYCGGDFQEG